MGRLIGIARAGAKRAPLVEIREATLDPSSGIEGDVRGRKAGRQVTVLFREGWEAACADIGTDLPWVTRRANLYVEGMKAPREGARLLIGELTLEVVQETQPCHLMEAAKQGLRAALTPEWRGGVCCRVAAGGVIGIGDEVRGIVSPREILGFWFKEIPRQNWFKADPEFDVQIRARFEESWSAASTGQLDDWAANRDGALALIILLDQFPRNMFRGLAEAFATDERAREVAAKSLTSGFDRDATADERNFFYLPFMHSENLEDQELCIRLIRERMGEDHSSHAFAQRHRDAVARFGRFPARNAALGRAGSEEEKAFLAKHPSGF